MVVVIYGSSSIILAATAAYNWVRINVQSALYKYRLFFQKHNIEKATIQKDDRLLQNQVRKLDTVNLS